MRGVEQIPWLYDAICAWAEWRGLGRWRRWVAGGARGRTLDLGCGTGRNLPLLPPTARAVFDTVVSGLVLCSVPDPARGVAEVRRVLRPDGTLRALEHVRATRRWKARVQDAIQPAWTWLAGGCHPNRETERLVEAAGFVIDAEGRRAEANLRRFAARPAAAGVGSIRP